ncbi:MAG TPA: hypothetical protein VGJ73_02710 [Verrucomicrobiae bacterium]|jgi:hypothetical protein
MQRKCNLRDADNAPFTFCGFSNELNAENCGIYFAKKAQEVVDGRSNQRGGGTSSSHRAEASMQVNPSENGFRS